MSLGEAVVDIRGDTSGLESDIGSKLKGIGGAVAKGVAVGTAALAAGAGAAAAYTLKLGEMADGLFDLQAITGASTDKLQEMRFVATQAGTNSDFFANSVIEINKRMSELEKGTGRGSEALARLGIATHDASGNMKSAQQITDETIQSLAGIEDPSLRAQLATDLFSRKANDLIPVLALGSDELARMQQEAHDLGGVLSEDSLTAADNFRQTVERLKVQVSGLANQAAAALAPALTEVAEFISDRVVPMAAAATERFGELWAVFSEGDGIVDGLMKVFGELTGGGGIGSIFAKVRDIAQNAFQGLVDWLATGGITQILNALLEGRQRLLDAALRLFPAILDAAIQFLPQLLTFITGQLIPSLLGFIVDAVPQLLAAAETLFASLVEAVATILPVLIETLLGTVLPSLLETVLGMIPQLLDTALTLFTTLLDAVVDILPDLISLLLGTVLPNLLTTLLGMIPQLLETAITVFTSLVTAILEVLPDLITTLLADVLPTVIVTLIEMIPTLLETAITVFMSLVEALIQVIPDLVVTIATEVIPALVAAIVEGVPKILGAAGDLIGGFIQGIKDKAGAVVQALKDFVLDKIPDAIKSFFGIGSPAKMTIGFAGDILDGLVSGFMKGIPEIRRAVDLVAAAATPDIGPVNVPVGALAAGAGVAAAAGGVRVDASIQMNFHGDITPERARGAGTEAAEAFLQRLSQARVVR